MDIAYGSFSDALPVRVINEADPDKPMRILWADADGHEWTTNLYGFDMQAVATYNPKPKDK